MTKLFIFFKPLFQNEKWPLFLALFSGLAVGTSYIPFPAWALLFGYSPLWIACWWVVEKSESPKQAMIKAFKLGWISQFVLSLIGFNWIYYVATEFGQLHPVLAATALLLFGAFMHLYIPLAVALAAGLAKKNNWSTPWTFFLSAAILHGLTERIWPSIFEWNLAYSLLWMKWPLFQLADFVGFWGLSTLLLVIQAIFADSLLFIKKDKEKALITIGMALMLFVFLNTWGWWHGQQIQKKLKASETSAQLSIGLVQGNVGNAEKIQSEKGAFYQSHILNLYSELTEGLLREFPQTQLILWPETALPFPLDIGFHSRRDQSQLLNFVQIWNRPLISGGYSVDLDQKDHLGNPLISNSVFFIGPEKKLITEPYNKTDLLVFGEYMPFGEYFPILYKWLPFVGIYKKGPGPTVYEIPIAGEKILFGPQICYESLNPGFSRGLNRKKSQIMFNVTNDSWFGWWAEPFQHQYMTLARAVETRTSLVRSTNTGVSSAILADGTILKESPINQKWAQSFDIRYFKKPFVTFYTKYGHLDWIIWLLVLVSFIFKKTARKNVSN